MTTRSSPRGSGPWGTLTSPALKGPVAKSGVGSSASTLLQFSLFVCARIFLLIICIILWQFIPEETLPFTRILLIANFILFMFLFLPRFNGNIDIFAPIYFVSVLFFIIFFIRPMQLLYHFDARSRFMPEHKELFQEALFLGSLGITTFYIGYILPIGNSLSAHLPNFRKEWRQRRILYVAFVYVIIGFAGYFFAISRSGGLSLFLSTLRGRRLLAESGSWAIASTRTLVSVTTLLVGAYCFCTGRLKLLFIIILTLDMGTSFITGGRSGALVTALALMTMFRYSRIRHVSKMTSDIVMVAIFGILAALFVVLLGTTRSLGRAGDVSSSLAIFASSDNAFFRRLLGEFGQFDWAVIVLDLVPTRIPFQYGATFLQFFQMFIPKAIWANKPVPVAYMINMAVGGARAGSPFTIIGELYLNFAFFGVIIGMFLFGLVSKVMYAYLRRNRGNPAILLIYAYYFASLHRLFTRSFAPKAFGLVLFLAPAIVTILFVAKRPLRSEKRRAS